MKVHFVVVVALLIGIQPGLSGQAPAQQGAATKANAENGRKLYRARGCAQCHNPEGQGGEAPRLGPSSLTLSAFTAYIRHPKNMMPPYLPRVASDAELADIYAFVQLAAKPPAASSIPLLNN